MESGKYIFISYRHQDRERVLPILEAIRNHYRFWYDKDIQAGERWTKELAEHIHHCHAFLAFLSLDYDASRYCKQEIRLAFDEQRPIIPVWLTDKDSLSPEVRMLLDNAQGTALMPPDDFAAWMDAQTVFRACRERGAGAVPKLAERVTGGHPTGPSPYFVGRVGKMREIEDAFRDGAAVVDLYGMGGLGKSEICRKLFQQYTAGRGSPFADAVGWLTWRGSLQSTFYGRFPNIREENAERYFQQARDYVNRKGRRLLIFLDNADTMTEAQAAELTELECRFLVTSRRAQGRFHAIPAGTLTPRECRILYRALSGSATVPDDSPDAVLDELLRLAGYHTLAVELLAKTQRAMGLRTAELLERLKESRFDLSGEDITYLHHPEQSEGGTEEDEERPFIEHMCHVFDLSQLDKPPKETWLEKLRGFFQKRKKFLTLCGSCRECPFCPLTCISLSAR